MNHIYFKAPSGIRGLAPDMIEVVYRYQNMQYRMEDVRNHITDMEENKVIPQTLWTQEDIKYLASEFLQNYDCNIDENSQFESLIKAYCLEKQNIDMDLDFEPDLDE